MCPAFTTMEEVLLCNFLSLRMMGNEYDFDLLILTSQETDHPEVEAPCYILLERPHGAGGIHNGKNNCIGFWFNHILPRLVT